MSTADTYRKVAAELRAKALNAPSDDAAVEYKALAKAYLRLAQQADENLRNDVWAEFGPTQAPSIVELGCERCGGNTKSVLGLGSTVAEFGGMRMFECTACGFVASRAG